MSFQIETPALTSMTSTERILACLSALTGEPLVQTLGSVPVIKLYSTIIIARGRVSGLENINANPVVIGHVHSNVVFK